MLHWTIRGTEPGVREASIQNTPGTFVRVRQNLVRRCHACIEVGGRQFEQLVRCKMVR